MIRSYLFLCLVLLTLKTASAQVSDKGISNDKIIIQKITDNVYQHITYLQTQTFGKVACNGMVVFDKGEAVIFDTPADDSTSALLLNWLKDSLNCKAIAVIPTHFHEDCVGGLREFHRRGVPSYANNTTIVSAKERGFPVPQTGFDKVMNLKVGKRTVTAEFFGEGHTRDNVIGYFPSDKIMFGGCLIKEINATKGNLADANVNAWPATVTKLKSKYPDTKVVIPGHGKSGDTALLDYTIKLFEGK
ncbi:subclass B1 metallo-beta-lactamase [Dyadobacter arcticus]|uniref:beta-lactamase n=1 Tax=Dyadobacter arcticus TaxID=1078754 RepID=A0ABX0ULC7_9BACT|nr:subclass B1 metallo-beta-lactamase [Dyadobacter arcticus]NIJ52480.1 metallo-beta-lactamase class B [Dyadobacter arcticus]